MEYKRLGDIATYINGYAFKPSDWSDVGLPIIRIQDLTGTSYQTNKYSGKYDSKYEINKGDVLISWSASLGVYVWNGDKALLNQHIFKVLFNKVEVDKDFFVHQVSGILRKSMSEAHGATMKHLTKPVFDALPFYLPSIERQREIAFILNHTVEIINKRKQQLQQLDELVKARFVEMFSEYQNRCSLNELCSIITDGTHQPPKFQNEGIPFIFVSNLANNTVTYNAEKFISDETYNELIKRTPIEIGDVLLTTVGSYGHPAVVVEDRKFLFQRHIAYLKPKRNAINSFFLHSAILAPDAQRQIEEKVKGIAQKTLNLSEIRKITIPVPSIDEQNAFEVFVKQVDKSKFAVQKALDEAQTLFDSQMQEYFG